MSGDMTGTLGAAGESHLDGRLGRAANSDQGTRRPGDETTRRADDQMTGTLHGEFRATPHFAFDSHVSTGC